MKILFCKDIISYLESSEEAMQIPNRIQTTIDRIRQKKKIFFLGMITILHKK